MTETTLRLRIHGKVQGVWYRGWTVEQARARHLRGWVRNRADGTVEAFIHGPDAAVRDMIEACKVGPGAARVLRVDTETVPEVEPIPEGFEQFPTL